MDKLMDYTLHKQMTEQQNMIEVQQKQIDKLASMIADQNAAKLNAPMVNMVAHLTQVNAIVNIKSFDGDERVYVPVSSVKLAFTENPKLVEYCQMSDVEKTDIETAAPFVLEALMDLIKRAHRNPQYRNVHLNPRRADQVMVCTGGGQKWEVRAIMDVIRTLFDGVAGGLHKIITTTHDRVQLPLYIQSAAAWVPNLYETEPDRFVKSGRNPMSAHLANVEIGLDSGIEPDVELGLGGGIASGVGDENELGIEI